MHLRWQMIDQISQCFIHGLAGDQVVVVQHKQDAFKILSNIVKEGGQHGPGRWRWPGLKQHPRADTDAGVDGLHCGHQIGQKLLQVPLSLVLSDPDARSTAAGGPLTSQRRFAQARWRANQCQLSSHGAAQPLDQARSSERPVRHAAAQTVW